MSTTITGRLNKPANQFQAGESTGFNVRLGVKYRDPKTKQDDWTNYSAVVFAKAPNQINFYQSALVEGAVVEVSGDTLKIDSYEGQNGTSLTIEILNARLGYIHSPQQQPQQQAAPQYQQPQPAVSQYRQPQQAQQYQQPAPQMQQPNDFVDDDLPF